MTSPFLVLFVIVFLFTPHYGEGSAVRIAIQPQKYDGVISTSVNISCTTRMKRNCALSQVLAIQLSKNGSRPLATIHQNSKISYNPLLRASIKAEGYIGAGAELEQSKLTVLFSDVVKEDSGLYSCKLIYLDQWDFMQQDVDMTNFTVEKNDMQDVLRYLMGKLSSMEADIVSQQKRLAEQEIRENYMQDVRRDLMGKLSSMEADIVSQQKRLAEQEKLIQTQGNQLKSQEVKFLSHIRGSTTSTTNEDSISGFSAGYIDNSISKGKTLVFSQELIDVGGDYDQTKGLFTAPRNGIYIFHLVLSTDRSQGYITVNLVAGGKVVATLSVGDPNHREQSSVSTLVSLKAGEEVKLVVWEIKGSFTDNNVSSVDHYSVFTGYLLKST